MSAGDRELVERARKASRFGKISQDHALLFAALADRLEQRAGWRDEDLAPAILEMARTAASRQEEGFLRNRALRNVEEVQSLPFTSQEWQTALADARLFLAMLSSLPPGEE